MHHLMDRFGVVLCGSTEGIKLPHSVWKWKSHACKRCAAIYHRRKVAFNLLQIETAAKHVDTML